MVVVGAGRVGHVLARAGGRLVRRGEPLPEGAPIVVCTRNDDVAAVIAATPPERRADLCFVQNGVLAPVLAAAGLGDATQGVLWFAAVDRSGHADPGPPSLFHGRHAASLVGALRSLGLPAEVLTDAEALRRAIHHKLLWNVVYGLLGERWRCPVGAVPEAQVRALVAELAPVLGVPADPEPHLAYAASIAGFPASLKEWDWRNGWVRERARQLGFATPQHDALLAEVGR